MRDIAQPKGVSKIGYGLPENDRLNMMKPRGGHPEVSSQPRRPAAGGDVCSPFSPAAKTLQPWGGYAMSGDHEYLIRYFLENRNADFDLSQQIPSEFPVVSGISR